MKILNTLPAVFPDLPDPVRHLISVGADFNFAWPKCLILDLVQHIMDNHGDCLG